LGKKSGLIVNLYNLQISSKSTAAVENDSFGSLSREPTKDETYDVSMVQGKIDKKEASGTRFSQ